MKDVIIFVADVENGVTDADEQVARILYRSNKPVVLAVNKSIIQNGGVIFMITIPLVWVNRMQFPRSRYWNG